MDPQDQINPEQPLSSEPTEPMQVTPPNNPQALPKLPDPPMVAGPQVFGPQTPSNIAPSPNTSETPGVAPPSNSPSNQTPQVFQFGQPSPPASAASKVKLVGSKRRLLPIFTIIFLIILVLGSAAAFAYYTVMNSKPEKVLADAISNTMKDLLDRKPSSMIGTLKYEFKDDIPGTITLDYNSKMDGDNSQHEASLNLKYDKIDATIKGAVTTIGDEEVYIKFDDLQKSIDQITNNEPMYGMLTEQYKPIIEKIDGKWIKIDKESLVEYGFVQSQEQVDKCSAAVTNLRISKEDQKKLKNLFLANQFLVASEKLPKESIDSETSYHYKIDFNEEASIQFTKSVVELDSFKTVKADCELKPEDFDKQVEDLKNNAQANSNEVKPVAELWVGRKTRRPTKLKITTSEETITVDFVATIKIDDKGIKVEAPSESINIKDLKADIEALASPSASTSTDSNDSQEPTLETTLN